MISVKYLLYSFQTTYFFAQIKNAVVGGTIPTIAQEKIYNFYIIVPDEFEQQEIVEYLDVKCAEIDSLIEKKTELLTKLDEYKKSVIYEYVTGKKEVV